MKDLQQAGNEKTTTNNIGSKIMKDLTSKALIERVYGPGAGLSETYKDITYGDLDEYLPVANYLAWVEWDTGLPMINHELYGVTEKDLAEYAKGQGMRYAVFHVGNVSYFGFCKSWMHWSYKDAIIEILASRNEALSKKAA